MQLIVLLMRQKKKKSIAVPGNTSTFKWIHAQSEPDDFLQLLSVQEETGTRRLQDSYLLEETEAG